MDPKSAEPTSRASTLIPIGELLAFRARQDWELPAVTLADVTITYADLDARSNRRARQLAAMGVVEGDVVTIALPNGFEFYETVFATWKLAATPNLVSSKLPMAELQAIVELAQPKLVIGAEHLGEGGWNFLAAGETPGKDISSDPLPTKVPARWKIQTSGGSTGRPKLIADKRPGLIDVSKIPAGLTIGDTVLNPGPLYHTGPFTTVSNCLFAGGHVVEMGKFDALRALELIERYRVNLVNFVPTMMKRIWHLPVKQRDAFDLSSLRGVWHVASVCPVWLKQSWIDWLGPERIFEMYGGAELIGTTVITGREWLEHKGSVGKVQPGFQMRIFDEDGGVCGVGEIGDIYFLPDKGPESTFEYIGATARTRGGGWQTYGDMGHVDEEGYLYIADRRTDLIVSGGANIFPAEVEAALDQHPDVQSSIVIGMPDADLGQRTHAIVQVASDARNRVGSDALHAFLADRLVRYKMPRTFEFTDENLRDDAGKARRTKLRDDRIAAGA